MIGLGSEERGGRESKESPLCPPPPQTWMAVGTGGGDPRVR